MKYRIGKEVVFCLWGEREYKFGKIVASKTFGSEYLIKTNDGEIVRAADSEIFPKFSKDKKDWNNE